MSRLGNIGRSRAFRRNSHFHGQEAREILGLVRCHTLSASGASGYAGGHLNARYEVCIMKRRLILPVDGAVLNLEIEGRAKLVIGTPGRRRYGICRVRWLRRCLRYACMTGQEDGGSARDCACEGEHCSKGIRG